MAKSTSGDGESIRVLRVFLASPGDLTDERRAARDAVSEINKTLARPAGFHVDLIGWEDTLSSAGRPQAIINEDLETCQMFIGMLWSRWGTAPSIGGNFTSGFEEEFHLAVERHDRSREPHICLFFKEVDASKVADPGPELSKVLAFKKRIIDDKKILFETFPDVNTLATKVRLSVAGFIQRLARVSDSSESNSSVRDQQDNHTAEERPDSAGNHDKRDADFLVTLGGRLAAGGDTIASPVEAARLRNIAAGYGHSQNDLVRIGPHDANILYKTRSSLDFSRSETSSLAYAGLEAWSHKNTPLWSWLWTRLTTFPMWLMYSTVIGPDERRIGALNALTMLRINIVEDEVLDKVNLEEYWFSGSVSDRVKNAALNYIKFVGTDDLGIYAEKELDRNNYSTRSSAFEAAVWVRSRNSVRVAARYATASSFDALSDETMKLVTDGMRELDDTELRTALDHRSGAIRAFAIGLLSDRKKIDELQVRRFFGVSSIEVRRTAVQAFEESFGILSSDEAKAALVISKKSGGLLGSQAFDFEGEDALTRHRRKHLSKRSIPEIEDSLRASPLAYEDHYFAKMEGHFPRNSKLVRHDIDDRFMVRWQEMIVAATAQYGNAVNDLINEHQEYRRRRMLREALNILLRELNRADLPRLRRVLDESATEPNGTDVDFLRRFGALEDIPRIIKIASNQSHSSAVSLMIAPTDMYPFAAALLKLSQNRLEETLKLKMPEILMKALVKLIPASIFRALDSKIVLDLLQNELSEVRKAAAFQVLKTYNKRKARALLEAYMQLEHTYYNVIFWLDICEKWDPDVWHQLAERELVHS